MFNCWNTLNNRKTNEGNRKIKRDTTNEWSKNITLIKAQPLTLPKLFDNHITRLRKT